MSRIRGKDTTPELVVRRLLHGMGYRYRLHRGNLPGKPDLVFPSRNKVVFVNGCFWHRHTCRKGQSMPSTRQAFWRQKFERNVSRDRQVKSQLRREGWKSFVVWECQLRNPDKLADHLRRFLDDE